MSNATCLLPNVSKPLRRSGAVISALLFAVLSLTSTALNAQSSKTEDSDLKVPKDQAVLELPTFSVSTTKDQGYRAGNSVSGTRIDTPIKELPFAVNAFTQQFITDIGARNLSDIVAYAPGVTSGSRQIVNGDASYMIRGFQQAPQTNGFSTPNSSVTGGPYVDSVAIERVEVVKGPASLLYGQVAPGGTVNYITKIPTAKRSSAISTTLGSYDFWRTTVDINQPIVSDKLMFRVNAAYENGYQYVQPSKMRSWVVAPTLLWQINDAISFKVDYQEFHRKESPPSAFKPFTEIVAAPPQSGVLGTAGVLVNPLDLSDPGFLGYFPLSRTFNFLSPHDTRESHFDTLAAELNIKLNDHWRARMNGAANWGYNGYKQTGLTSVNIDVPTSYTSRFPTYSAAAAAFAGDLLNDMSLALTAPHAQLPRRQAFRETYGRRTALQAELVGAFKLNEVKLQPLFGAYYDTGNGFDRRRQTGSNGTYTVFTAPSAAARVNQLAPWDFINPNLFPQTETDFDAMTLPLTTYTGTYFHTKAIYALLNAKLLNDRLILIGGARYNWSDTSITNFLTNPAVVNPLNPTFSPTAKAEKLTPQVAAGFKLRPDVLVYASYSESYQANTFLKAGDQPGILAKPTTSTGVEVGVKTDLLDGRISSTVALYSIDQTDRIISLNVASLSGAVGSYDFQGTVDRSQGIEAEVTYSPINNWQIYTSAALNDVRTIQVGPGLEVYRGTHPQATAHTLANLWTRYSFTDNIFKGMWVGAGLNYTSEKASINTNSKVFLPATTLYQLALGYDWKYRDTKMSAVLNWHNITDVEFFPAVQDRGLPSRGSITVTARF
jgi:iron complex outermembrane receptor protein